MKQVVVGGHLSVEIGHARHSSKAKLRYFADKDLPGDMVYLDDNDVNKFDLRKMEEVYTRRVILTDLSELQNISRQTFLETFSEANTQENMEAYLEEAFSLKKLADELNSDNSEFYFAILVDTIVGYVKINFGTSQTELKDSNALEIERIYVLRQYHGRNIGQLLYEKAIEIARRMNAAYVWLGVWEENSRAIKFYQNNGFVGFDKHIFRLGNDEQTDIMMKLHLR